MFLVNFDNLEMWDIISDVFMAIWRNYKKLDTNMEIKPYLIGITKTLFTLLL